MNPSHRTLVLRILSGIFMVMLIAWGYWWIIGIVACIFLFLYNPYYEMILWGICFDALYASPTQSVYDYRTHIAFLISAVLFFVSIFLKKRLAFYS